MLEKIGLPAKPSLRGNTWVVDASHCQGCASQFTFINRKHHCRRCGGLFCNTCTQQRMFLRGQGDSPVRICDPCKQVEDAAKFERRYGPKSKAGKADSNQEDDLLHQLLSDGKDTLSSRRGSLSSVSNIPRSTSSASSSTAQEGSVQNEGKELGVSGSKSDSNDMLAEMGSVSPEKLRQQAIEEKNKYKSLKADGKAGEALKAFKRGKELEREAAALELSLRKNRKKAVTSISMVKADSKVADADIQPALSTRKDKDDISAELRELGWSDKELHGADKKTGTMSLEGELSTLIVETFQNGKANKSSSAIDKSEVTALRRKALAFKREGRMAEAKEELKKAKILERELEEQELLGEADDSDDEFASLIKSMGADKPDDLLITDVSVPTLNIDQLMRMADDVGEDGEVTEADLDDPEISAALKSFGWSEDESPPEKSKPRSEPMDHESLLQQIQSLKQEALNKKRAGNTSEAMSLLKKAKLLERELDAMQGETSEVFGKLNKEFDPPTVEQSRPPRKSKIMIQRELLGLKKKALSLRREGKLDEAEEELKKAKILEQLLEEFGISKGNVSQVVPVVKEPDLSTIMDIDDKGEEEDVTENDLHDPTYLLLLSNLGWKDNDAESTSTHAKPTSQNGDSSKPSTDVSVVTGSVRKHVAPAPPRRSKAELQRELLGLKRKALTLRRQGQNEEAEEVLSSAKLLEEQLAEMEVPKKQAQPECAAPAESESNEVLHETVVDKDAKTTSTFQPIEVSLKTEVEHIVQPIATTYVVSDGAVASSIPLKEKPISNSASPPLSSRDRFKLQQKSLAHKRQALKLRREGRTDEADAEFQLAKEIENQLEDSASQSSSASSSTNMDTTVEDLFDPQLMSALQSIGITDTIPPPQNQARAEPAKQHLSQPSSSNSGTGQERTQLEQQIKVEKMKAVTLKREGKQAEALNTLRHAKMLEKKLQSLPS
ncbi:unnamed protein product [Rhodiola kirilowii]